MKPTIDFSAIVEELRNRLSEKEDGADKCSEAVKDKIRCRLAVLLDADPDSPLEDIVDKLDEKWRRDGLI